MATTNNLTKVTGRDFRSKKKHFGLPTLHEVLKMLIPFLGIIIVYLVHVLMPTTYVMGYTPGFMEPFLAWAAVFYAFVYFVALFFVALRKWLVKKAWFIWGLFVFLALWDVATIKTGIFKMPFMPSPERVMFYFSKNYAAIPANFEASMHLLLVGMVVGFVIGMVSGVLCGYFQAMNYWVSPLMKIIGPVPAFAWLPVLAYVLGGPVAARIGIIVIAIWFPLALLVSSSIRNTDKRYLERARISGASPFFIVWHVLVPASTSAIVDGAFMAFTASFGALGAAETVGVSAGLRLMIAQEATVMDYGGTYAYMIICIVVFSTITAIVFAVRNYALRWQKGVVRW